MSAPSLDARFRPLRWAGDEAVESGPGEAFDAAEALLSLTAEQFRYIDVQMGRPGDRDLDEIAYAAGLVGEGAHRGPFSVTFDGDAWRGFLSECGLSDVAAITDEAIAEARALLAGPAPSR